MTDSEAIWRAVHADFAWDGALRDIYVRPVTLRDWEAVLALILRTGRAVLFEVDGEASPLPPSAAEAIGLHPERSPVLRFDLGPVHLVCHFWDSAEIEFDVDPRAVDSPAALRPILEFLEALAKLTGAQATLTHENMPEAIIVEAHGRTGDITAAPDAVRRGWR